MATEIKSPTFPESVADGTIANWAKKEGESVKQDEVIAEIETDKVVLEVVAPYDGTISKILKSEGEIVQSAEVIAEFDKQSASNTSDAHNQSAQANIPQPKVSTVKESSDVIKNGPAASKLIKEHNLSEDDIDGS